jgi:hypothetical protein
MTTSTLIEHVTDWHREVQVDRLNLLVRNVALTGLESKNGYRYTEQALREAVGLYDGKPVFLDHAADRARPLDRSTRDLVGTITQPRFAGGRIRGDIHVLDTESGRTFLALSGAAPPGVGMSHVVIARRTEPQGMVDRITDVVSVDAVVFPATTSTFHERAVDATPDAGDRASVKECEMVRDPLTSGADAAGSVSAVHEVAACRIGESEGGGLSPGRTRPAPGCSGADRASAEGESARREDPEEERRRLRAEVEQLRRERDADRRSRRTVELLAESGLPAFAVTPAFRRQLLAARQEECCELIRERMALVEAARRISPVSVERQSARGEVDETARFIASIRRSRP